MVCQYLMSSVAVVYIKVEVTGWNKCPSSQLVGN